jgi:pyridoxamine 5'-phosphate oxidase
MGELRMKTDILASDDALTAADPFDIFDEWMREASASEINDPNAMSLATVSPDGWPSVRTVLLKGLDPAGKAERGFVFYTNLDSHKGRDLKSTPRAALLFHWKSLRRQIRIEGTVTTVSTQEADAYFASRPRGARIGAWASRQSALLEGRGMLEDRVREMEARFGENEVPRPDFWSGFRVTPRRMEFWQDRQFRLHDRAVFEAGEAGWTWRRLFP